MLLNASLEGFCTLVDESTLVSEFRLLNSAPELTYVRRAAELADLALRQGERNAQPARTKERSLRRCREQSSKEAGIIRERIHHRLGKEALLCAITAAAGDSRPMIS